MTERTDQSGSSEHSFRFLSGFLRFGLLDCFVIVVKLLKMELNLSPIQRLLLAELMESSSSDDSSSSSSDSYDDDQDLLLQCYAQSIHKEERPKVVDYIRVVEAYTDHEVGYIRHKY